MCEPLTILAAASTAAAAAGLVMQGNAAAAEADYNAAVQRNNAILSANRAQQERDRGRQEEDRKRREIARVVGSQRAQTGASGIELSSGSPLDVLTGTIQEGEVDALQIRRNAEQRARDYEYEGRNLRAEAVMTERAGQSARRQGFLSAGGTVLGGASKWGGDLFKGGA